MKLTAEAVESLFAKCLRDKDAPLIEGVVNKAHLDVTGHEKEIGELLDELPETFQYLVGGGMSFLQACEDKHGNQWTGMHQTMDMLFMLGIAAQMAVFLFPRDTWKIMPGGVPYISVHTKGFDYAGSTTSPGSS